LVSNKSDILKILSNNYPNFLKKDLSKFIEIVLNEIQDALKRNERIELRDNFTLEGKIQKARIARNPKTNEKINIQEKKLIKFKMSKEWFKKINEKI
jgi:integration host factor subunit beta